MDNNTYISALKMEYVKFFQAEIIAGNYANIQKLYDAARITNDDLIRQMEQHTAAMTDLNRAVFNDIAFILAEEFIDHEELVSVFDELYYPQFKSVYDTMTAAANVIGTDYDRGIELLGKVGRKVMHYSGYGKMDMEKMKAVTKTSNYCMMSLLHYRLKPLVDAGTLNEASIFESAENWAERQAGTSELHLNDKRIVFSDDQAPVFQSRMYERFKNNQREAMANYLGTTSAKLISYIEHELSYDVRSEDFSFLTTTGDAGISNMATIHVVQSNYGGSQWLHTVTSSRGIRKGSTGYRPDIEKIMDCYYRARVMVKYTEVVNSHEEFTRFTLSRGCKADSPKDDYLAILYLCNVDIVYQMFKIEQELYYRNFSWESISKQSALSRSNQIVQEMRNIVAEKDRQITNLNQRLLAAETLNGKSTDESQKAALREQNKLLDALEQKDAEIAALKERLQYQDELLEELSKSDEDDESQAVTVDMDSLQQKRYLFVGHTEADFPELNHALKKAFPGSIFMRSETDNIDGIKVDAIVIFLKWVSHGMYYKVRANKPLENIPTVYCKTKNIDRIYQEMYSALLNS